MAYKDKNREKEYNKKYYEKNKEKLKLERDKPENKEKAKRRSKEWEKNNKTRRRKQKRLYRIKNKEKLKEKEREYEQRQEVKARRKLARAIPENKEKKKIYMRKFRKNSKIKQKEKEYEQRPEVKLRRRKRDKERRRIDNNFGLKTSLRSNFNNGLRRYSKTGKIYSSSKYGIDYEKIIEHLKPFPPNIKDYEIDHIIPLCMFDHNDPEQIKLAWAPTNCAWLLKEANRSKGDKLVHPDFYKKYGYNSKNK